MAWAFVFGLKFTGIDKMAETRRIETNTGIAGTRLVEGGRYRRDLCIFCLPRGEHQRRGPHCQLAGSARVPKPQPVALNEPNEADGRQQVLDRHVERIGHDLLTKAVRVLRSTTSSENPAQPADQP